ncbi:uncharacterized protein RJT20DRAFT_5363 [Scheffersomyces xylosifermentans]|uniref:uncharacterized protein n=1 Tax=Scheffersomyces xylosifermentans TaxID=1304137 RepID=UPI00315D5A91
MVSSVTSFRGRSVLYEGRFFFPSLAQPNDWSPERAFAILIRKYVVYGVLCGTNRIFLSDHETFSGFWNGSYDKPIHLFEYLGEEVPENAQSWQSDKIGAQRTSSVGISHNDMRIPNIHVSRSGKISLIDFGLSDSSNSESHKQIDFEILDDFLGIYGDDDDGDEDTSYAKIIKTRPRLDMKYHQY